LDKRVLSGIGSLTYGLAAAEPIAELSVWMGAE